MKIKWKRSFLYFNRGGFMQFKFTKLLLVTLCCLITHNAIAQNITITGVVTDASTNDPLIGVNIIVEGTTTGTTSDLNGNYKIELPKSGATLVFSFLGYQIEKVQVTGQSVNNVKLVPEIKNLEEVVVVGYGTVKKKDITGSVSSIKSEQIKSVPVSDVSMALQGKLAGVSVISQDGRPDASVAIRIRGGGSVSQSNDPLIIVDGFPVSSLSNIPSNIIESIDVLKDASSTAIYGARGANGVIIITTKSGKTGKMKVSYDGYAKFNSPTKYLKTMNSYDYLAYNWAYAAAISDTYADGWEMLWGIGRYEDTYNNPDGIDHYRNISAKDYTKEVYSNSFSHCHNLNISGGNENTQIFIGINRLEDDGMKINSWFNRTNASLKLDQKISKKLSFVVDSKYSNVSKMGNEGTTNGSGSILSSAYWFRPIATSDVLGELDDSKNTALGMYDNYLQDEFSPVARIKDYESKTRERNISANVSLKWDVVKGLVLKSEIGLTSYWNKSNVWSGAIYNNYFDDDGNKTYGGDAEISSTEGWSLRWVNTLNYAVQGLGENHSWNWLFGQECSNSGSEKVKITGSKYPASFDAARAFAMMDQYSSSTDTKNYSLSSTTGTPNRMLSFFGRTNYSYKDRYLFTATLRADGSSRFAESHRWGYFPAAAFAWRISEEKFLKDNVSWLDNLKLRLSYGSVGSDGISSDLWKMSWASGGSALYSIDEVQQSYYKPASTTIANPDLKWETTITRNLGLDFSFLRSRIYGTVEYYWNSTKDLLMLTKINSISGFTYTYDNIGSTSNKGLEISLGGDIIRSAKFNLSANIVININKNKIEELADGVNGLYSSQWGSSSTQPSTGDYILKEGQPVGLVRGYKYDGWYTTGDFTYENGKYTLNSGVPDISSGVLGTVYGTSSYKPSGQVAYPGALKLKDVSGDGIVNDDDVDVIGNTNPKHTGGFNIQGNYNNIDFMFGFNWSYGNDVYNANYLEAFTGGKENGLYKNRFDVLSSAYKIYDIQDGQLVSITDPDALNTLNANATTYMPFQENPVVSSLGIQDGSFLRLNTVSVGYSLPKKYIKINWISKVRVYGTIYNAYTWTNYKGLDPEVNTNTSLNSANYPTLGLDWGAYPRARSYVVGLNLEF